jgi:hypothetical protein
MLVALAVPALAESPIDFKGHYRVWHANNHNYSRNWRDNDWTNREDDASFFRHRLNLDVTFHATEDIDIVWNLRVPNYERWGQQDGTALSRAFYAEIRQPWGTVQVGRLADGLPGTVGGLATLGHGPSFGSGGYLYTSSVFNFNGVVDGITYNHDFGNGFGLAAYYFKFASTDHELDDLNSPKDEDHDRFGVEPRYTWDGGGVTLGLIYDRDMTQGWDGIFFTSAYVDEELDPADKGAAHGPWGAFSDHDNLLKLYEDITGIDLNANDDLLVTAVTDQDYTFIINPAFTHSWGAFSIGFEAAFAWGNTKYLVGITPWDLSDDPPAAIHDPIAVLYDVDKEGYGLFFDANYNYGAGDLSFLFWLVDGTNWEGDDDEIHDAVSLGDFSPFIVAFGYNGFGHGYEGSLNSHAFAQQDSYFDRFEGVIAPGGTNQWGIGLLGNHNFTDDIRVNWGIGYFALVNPIIFDGIDEDLRFDDRVVNRKKDLGWEIDIGATFQLLDNLTFETQFGYFFNGGAFDTWTYDEPTDTVSWHSAKDTFAWYNVLNVSF